MPVERREISVSQFAELLGVEAERVLGVEKRGSTMVLILEPEVTADGSEQRVIPATEDRRQDHGKTQDGRAQEDHGLDGIGHKEDTLQLLRRAQRMGTTGELGGGARSMSGNAQLAELVARAEASALKPSTNQRNKALLKELCFALVALAQLVAKQQAEMAEKPRIVTP